MKKKNTLLISILLILVMSVTAFATSDEGEIKYREHNVYVSGYIDFVNGLVPVFAPDLVWARATLYGSDLWYVGSAGDGTSAICKTSNGKEVFNKILTATNTEAAVNEKGVGCGSTYATLTLKVLADNNNTLVLKATD